MLSKLRQNDKNELKKSMSRDAKLIFRFENWYTEVFTITVFVFIHAKIIDNIFII